MPSSERRQDLYPTRARLQNQLNDTQLRVLRELEYFGWELKFVRHPKLRDPVPVVFADERNYVALRADGSLDERPRFKVRH
ncbi:hypothetical protein [Lysobacter sp. D1-1-M9]|uniref:hypothetical protein n=2 Tax=Novilysobacter TaxID=3382699 RepID=UPI002FC960C2